MCSGIGSTMGFFVSWRAKRDHIGQLSRVSPAGQGLRRPLPIRDGLRFEPEAIARRRSILLRSIERPQARTTGASALDPGKPAHLAAHRRRQSSGPWESAYPTPRRGSCSPVRTEARARRRGTTERGTTSTRHPTPSPPTRPRGSDTRPAAIRASAAGASRRLDSPTIGRMGSY